MVNSSQADVSLPLIFLYEEELRTILDPESPSFHRVTGGRGFGKTLFLAELARYIQRETGKPPVSIPGRQRQSTVKMLEPLTDKSEARTAGTASAGSPTWVLMDDLDFLFLPMPRDSEAGTVALHERLGRLTARVSERPDLYRLVVTSTSIHSNFIPASSVRPEDASYAADRWGSWSNLWLNAHPVELDPWPVGWRETRREQLKTVLSRFGWGQEAKNAWIGAIMKLTGGHPALLGGAVKLIGDCRGRVPVPTLAGQTQTQGEQQVPENGELVEEYLEDYLVANCVGIIRRTLASLMNEDTKPLKGTLDFLSRLIAPAKGGGESASKHDFQFVNARVVARALGLVYRDKTTGIMTIPGHLVAREIELATGGSQEAVPFDIELVPRSGRGGTLRLESRLGDRAIDLPDNPFQLLVILHQHRGKPVSLEDLAKATGLKEASARTAALRLMRKLEDDGLYRVVRNVYGQGYMLEVTMSSAPK